jgi:hypothetical protein
MMSRKNTVYWLLGFSLLALLILLAPFFAGQTLVPGDTLKSMPLSKFGADEFFSKHYIVQWMPHIFGGMPCFSSVMVTPSYWPSVLTSWVIGPFIPVFKDPLVLHFLHILLMSLGSWLFLRRLGLSSVAAAFGALNLILLTTNLGLIGAGHTIKLWTIAWMPLALYYLHRLLHEENWRLLVPGALVLGSMLSAKHVQMSWYFLILAGFYTLSHFALAMREKKRAAELWPPLVRAALWLLLGLLLVAFLYLPILDYSSMSMRASTEVGVQAGSYASSYSFPLADVISWWIPGAKGFGGSSYWGALQYTAFPLYMGALSLPFFILAFIFPESRRRVLPFMLPAIFLLLLGLGKYTPFFALFVKALPFYAKFRAHMWALAVVQMLMVFLAAMGLDQVLKTFVFTKSDEAKLPLYAQRRAWFAGGGLLLLLAFFSLQVAPSPEKGMPSGSSFQNEMDETRVLQWFQQQGQKADRRVAQQLLGQLRAMRAQEFYQDSARTLAIFGLCVLLFAMLMRKEKAPLAVALGLALLLMIDLLPQASRTLNFQQRVDAERLFKPAGIMGQLAQMPNKFEFRIWPRDGYGHNEAVWHGLHSINGYHGAKPSGIQRILNDGTRGPSLAANWLDLLNVRYVLSYEFLDGLVEVARAEDGLLLENRDCLDRISFPKRWTALPGAEHFDRVMQADFDPRDEVLIDGEIILGKELGPATGKIISYEPDHIIYSVQNPSPCLALFSEVWLPRGWVALLNGEEVPILRANHIMRGLALPEGGTHRIEFLYRPAAWIWTWPLSLLTLLSLLLASVQFRRKCSKSDSE